MVQAVILSFMDSPHGAWRSIFHAWVIPARSLKAPLPRECLGPCSIGCKSTREGGSRILKMDRGFVFLLRYRLLGAVGIGECLSESVLPMVFRKSRYFCPITPFIPTGLSWLMLMAWSVVYHHEQRMATRLCLVIDSKFALLGPYGIVGWWKVPEWR